MDLEPVSIMTVVLLEAEWPVVKDRELAEALKPTHVIVRRSDLQTTYYLYISQEALRLLRDTDEALSIQEASDLREAEAFTPGYLVGVVTNQGEARWCS